MSLDIISNIIAGYHTAIYVKSIKVLFDVGIVLPESLGANVICISHGHLDHISALPLYLRQRKMTSRSAVDCLIPQEIELDVRSFLESALLLDNPGIDILHDVDIEKEMGIKIVPLKHGETYACGKLRITAHRMIHRVVSYGYTIETDVRELIEPIEPTEIPALIREKGIAGVFRISKKTIYGYTGDTTIEGVLANKAFSEVETLIIECTYATKHDSDHADKHGHIHYNDILNNISWFKAKTIKLVHLSMATNISALRDMLHHRLTL